MSDDELKVEDSEGGERFNPFDDRVSAQEFIRESFDEYRRDYRAHREALQKSLEETKGNSTALIEARVAIISSLKTLQTNYTRWLLDITKSKNLLSNLDPPKQEGGNMVINIILPEWGVVPIVDTRQRPKDDEEPQAA
jgi:hypothetical protein